MNLLHGGKLKYHNIPINHLINFTVPAEYHNFSKSVITNIVGDLIKLWEEKHGILNIPDLQILKDICWRWTTPEGNFTTHLAKQIKTAWDLNIPTNALELIGNIARTDYVPTKEIYFDITNDFGWKSGDFGDGGSCFWQGRKDIRKAMKSEGNFYAIRIFEPCPYYLQDPHNAPSRARFYLGYTGIGRSWLYETNIQLKLPGGSTSFPVIILFNSYGMNISFQSLVLAAYLKKERGHCALTNKGKQHGGLYVNGPGYIIGTQIVTKSVQKFDFGLQNSYDVIVNNLSRVEPTPIRFENIPGGGIRKKKIRTKTERLQLKHDERERSRLRTSANDYSQAILHQRYLQTISSDVNRNWVRDTIQTIKSHKNLDRSTPQLDEVRKRLDSLTPIYKKLRYDPIRIIHHHIKHHLL